MGDLGHCGIIVRKAIGNRLSQWGSQACTHVRCLLYKEKGWPLPATSREFSTGKNVLKIRLK